MLYGFLCTLYSLACIFLVFLVLLQKSKSSLGIGSVSGSNQLLFGGSGGQDIFQKTTWILGAILLSGSLSLALLRSTTYEGPVTPQVPMSQQLPIAEF